MWLELSAFNLERDSATLLLVKLGVESQVGTRKKVLVFISISSCHEVDSESCDSWLWPL